MTIHFYLDNEEETQITIFYEMQSNPFKIGDEINITIDDLAPRDYYNHTPTYTSKLRADENQLKERFHLQKIKLLKEGKYIRTNVNGKNHITFEYHCTIVED